MKNKIRKIKLKCAYCNSIFYRYFSMIKNNKRCFCSNKCKYNYFDKYGYNRKKIYCKQCYKEFELSNAFINDKGNCCSRKCYAKWMSLNWKGKNNPHYGKKWSEKSRINVSKNWHKVIKRVKHLEKLNKTKKRFGKYNPNWQDGISFEPYGFEFNDELKEFVRKRDKFKCQNLECGTPQKENIFILRVHHIDYDKYNNDPINLITLCNSCNIKANYNRKYWQEYYENIQIKRKVHELEKYVN